MKAPTVVVLGSFGATALLLLTMGSGLRVPYVYTSSSQLLRGALFFVLLSLLIYFSFLYRKRGKRTFFQAGLATLDRSTRLKLVAGVVGAQVIFAATAAWMSIGFPAWAAQLFATRPYAEVFEVRDVSGHGRIWSRTFDIAVSDVKQQVVCIRLPRWLYEPGRPWRPGDNFCVKGRTSMFGTAIDSISKDSSLCGPTP
jgi:hypothetical protein